MTAHYDSIAQPTAQHGERGRRDPEACEGTEARKVVNKVASEKDKVFLDRTRNLQLLQRTDLDT